MNRQRTALGILIVALFIGLPQHLHACTGSIRGSWNSWNYVKVNLSGFPADLQALAQTALGMAMAAWNNTCTEGTIPRFVEEVPSGGAYFVRLTFEFVAGAYPNPGVERVCGSLESASLAKLYAFQWDGGQLKPCPTSDLSKLAHVFAHELGHRLGLSDSDCFDHIMSRLPSGADSASVKPAECSAANSLNSTAGERGVCDQPNDCRVSPILLSCQADPWTLTSVAGGVAFDYDGDDVLTQTAWTRGQSRVGFLFLDMDGTGCAESGAELFGENRTIGEGSLAANGFEALEGYDSDRNGWITSRDNSWRDLRMWFDRSHDGVCDASEVETLPEARVVAIELRYGVSSYIDENGNAFKYFARSLCRRGNDLAVIRTVWDVFFATAGQD